MPWDFQLNFSALIWSWANWEADPQIAGQESLLLEHVFMLPFAELNVIMVADIARCIPGIDGLYLFQIGLLCLQILIQEE